MARRAVIVNGSCLNGDSPPPSTLAAQIVQNQARKSVSQQSGESATFHELLHEILHNKSAVQETDIAVNAQLISVVTQLGLLPLTTDNPFADWDTLLADATNSIAVIEKTVKRQPEVVLIPLASNEPQLLLSLLATLIALCGRQKCERLSIHALLSTTITALDSSIHSWKSARILQEVVQECIDDTLSALETSSHSSAMLALKLPPARSISKLWPDSEGSITTPQGSTTTISDAAQAFALVNSLYQISGLPVSWQHAAKHRLQSLMIPFRKNLEQAGQWDFLLEQLLRLPQSEPLLVSLFEEISKSVPSKSVQLIIAQAIFHILEHRVNESKDILLPAICLVSGHEVWLKLDEKLQIAVCTWLCRLDTEQTLPEHVLSFRDALRHDNVMSDDDLQSSFQRLSVSHVCSGRRSRQRKRRRVDTRDTEQQKTDLVGRVTGLLPGVRTSDMSAFPEVALSVYATLHEEDKQATWQSLADLAKEDLEMASRTISRLLGAAELHDTKRPRVLSVLAVRACVELATDENLTALGTSQFGKYCLSCIHSSLRELRLAAAHTLPAFLRDDLPDQVRMQNRQLALEYLRTLSSRDVANEQETLISAWGQVAISCGEKELNLVLVQLVEYLGHGNPLLCALAFSEIEIIAAAKHRSMLELFRPFWQSIAVSVVQDLDTKPNKAQQLSELLGMDMNGFLATTQRFTLPTLVLTRKKDVLGKVASARGTASVRDLCIQPLTNLAAIVTMLLNQSRPDPEEFAFSCLLEVDPGFNVTDLAGLVRMDAALVACEMLKYCGEESDSRKARSYQAFQIMVHLEQSSPGQRKSHAKGSKSLSLFFDKFILGILTHFSTRLEEHGPGAETMSEKVRCLKALAELFTLTKGDVSSALPQMRACIKSGLAQPPLCDLAFNAWLTLLPLLPPEDVALVIDEFFVWVARHWSALSGETQKRTHKTIGELVKAHNTLLQENIMTLPSLEGIPLLSKFAAEFERLKVQETPESHCRAFVKRLRVGADAVVVQALTELVPFLEDNQEFIHDTAASEHPSTVLSDLLCALLDVTVKHASVDPVVAELSGRALGLIGSVDPNRVDTTRRKRHVLIMSNFEREAETVDWVLALLEDVLVKAFKSATNARAQGFLAFTMQELLKACGLAELTVGRTRASQGPYSYQRWDQLPEQTRITLTPFLSSRYVVTSSSTAAPSNRNYPGFTPDADHDHWLRSITYDLMFKAKGDNAKNIFPLLARVMRNHDLAIARFVFPFAVLNVVLGGTVGEVDGLTKEFLAVLMATPDSLAQQECIRSCSETVFTALDCLSRWLQEKRRELAEVRNQAYKTGHPTNELEEVRDMGQIETIENFLTSIPAEVIANRAVDCRSYARALFHWEQHIRGFRPLVASSHMPKNETLMYERLQDIYSQIDEPDGLEGIASHLPIISEDQQAFNHAKSGRWTAAQAWYELKLAEHPEETELQRRVLRCLKETGQYAPLLKYANAFLGATQDTVTQQAHLPLAIEASWMTENVNEIPKLLALDQSEQKPDFETGIGRSLYFAEIGDGASAFHILQSLRKNITESLSMASTDTLHSCHNELLRLHAIYEMEAILNVPKVNAPDLLLALEKRHNAMGSYVQDKQYILGIRRAAMRLRPDTYQKVQVGAMWLATAKLARKAGNTISAYNAVLKAAEFGERGAKLEQARLLWREGHQRQAVQLLEAAIESGIFACADGDVDLTISNGSGEMNGVKQNMLSGKALLLLAKWLDASGQSQTKDMTERYQVATRKFQRWERGHYYLGKHYSKLLEAQKALPRAKQSAPYLTGDLAKLVIDNSLRSIPFGNKYWHETIPRILTLWLELGAESITRDRSEDHETFEKRATVLRKTNSQLRKYFERVPAYVFYHALPQMISRITHPHPEVWKELCNILTRIAAAHPSQALWSLLAVVKAKDPMRVERGTEVLNKLKDPRNKPRSVEASMDLRSVITQGQRLCDGLLQASERPVDARVVQVSLSKDLAFNMKLAPSQLVVPIEATLIATAPASATCESIRRHRAFAQDKVTIAAFTEDVLVLNSLQRPRKITLRGSDGKYYGLLCKPKDDLRKDQRLMEFNGIINRALKRDTESSKRRLYIKTYAVTPLSEESGCIEWVEGIKPTRDILLAIYSRKGVRPNYTEIKKDLDVASSAPEHAHVFAERVINQFPASLHEWFSETYPEPDTWFAARLRYSRSAAVMSMVGHILGLGDRHGENILLEESTGGVFHVDFNCLFDKGLTFEKPELVPFRLTHNMQDAMGPYGCEGPFRKSSELTLGLLRQERDTLMTVLETFLYDPTTDFVQKKKSRAASGAPETPAEILESVATKLRGLLRGETVPLSVEGYVDALIQEATSHFRLASMYIGWCSFL